MCIRDSSQAYAGHQFGHFSILGDGRAHLIGEHIAPDSKCFDIQFKGSGQTPYSRNGDGRAALAPMLREYIISEAMHELNIPTTRSLAVVSTGESIMRSSLKEGAILTRIAESHIRVGTFEYANKMLDLEELKALADYAIARHYPELLNQKNPYLSFLKAVITNQAKLIASWMHVGFINVDGEKMSKSLGNFFTIRDILEKYDGEVVRFFLISSHYRSHVSYMDNSLDDAHGKLARFYNALSSVENGGVVLDVKDLDNDYSTRFHAAMDDDFNTPEAIAALFDLVREVNKTTGEEQQALAGQLKYLGGVLGCLQADPQTFLQAGAGDDAAWIEEMIAKRIAAKKAKDFATADAVRDELVAKGIVLKDGPEGTVWTKS